MLLNFPGGPVVKTPCFQRRVREFHPWVGNLRPHMLHSTAKK